MMGKEKIIKVNGVKYFSKTALIKERGWTKALVERLLGEPDLRVLSPYKRGQFIALYEASRVLEAEEKFKAELERVRKRKEAAQRAALERARKVIEFALTAPIEIPLLEPRELVNIAVAGYNSHWTLKGQPEKLLTIEVFLKKDPGFKARLMVNALRHTVVRYEEELEKLKGKPGVRLAYYILKIRTLVEIVKTYSKVKNRFYNTLVVQAIQQLKTATDEFLLFYTSLPEPQKLLGPPQKALKTLLGDLKSLIPVSV